MKSCHLGPHHRELMITIFEQITNSKKQEINNEMEEMDESSSQLQKTIKSLKIDADKFAFVYQS